MFQDPSSGSVVSGCSGVADRRGPILVIDDEELNLSLLRRILDFGGFHDIEAASDPCQTIRILDVVRPCLILLDLHMPDMDGLEVLDRIRIGPFRQNPPPILLLTGDDTTSMAERALSLGATDILYKPFQVTDVLGKVGSLLRSRSLGRRSGDRL